MNKNKNLSELSQLCDEFRFGGLSDSLSSFRDTSKFKSVQGSDARLFALKELTLQHQRQRQLEVLESLFKSQTQQVLNSALAPLTRVEAALSPMKAPFAHVTTARRPR
jgi:hypothetical protein